MLELAIMLTNSTSLKSPPDLPLPKTNTKVGDQDAYATSDLVVAHPTKPGLWKIIGRADEQIILSNGEKVRPPGFVNRSTPLISDTDEPCPARSVPQQYSTHGLT